MKKYTITDNTGKVIATLTCEGLLVDLDHPNEHVLPLNDTTIAARLVLGDGMSLQEAPK